MHFWLPKAGPLAVFYTTPVSQILGANPLLKNKKEEEDLPA
jgi:hypothetical protein